ncbi:MAG: DinB family protein [Acidobacteriota bacterium]
MVETVAAELIEVVEATASELRSLDENLVRARPAPGKWSIQEIVGHLMDSAVNNHHRFVRAQETDPLVFPGYEQDNWVNAQGYNHSSWRELVELWRLYNGHLAQLMRRIPQQKLAVECRIGPYDPVTLEFLVEDYLAHLKHHLQQVENIRLSAKAQGAQS